MDFGTRGRLIAITGGASGIGLSTARILADEGADVVLLDRDEEAIEKAVAELRSAAAAIHGFVLDVTSENEIEDRFAEIETKVGPVDGLVASAGISIAAPAERLTADEWERVFSVNARGVFLSCRTAGSAMLSRGSGSIVIVGSIDGLAGQPGRTAYSASKFAAHGLVQSLALEWGRRGVRVNGVAPSFVDTPMLRANMPPAFIDTVIDRTPMGRIAKPEDIGHVVVSLLSDAMAFVNGIVIPIDGGLLAGPFTRRSGADLSSRRLLEAGLYEE
jgi:NAD(P)-dependent dehydrogenase (short-subunit alcohol dehydrogenase family)